MKSLKDFATVPMFRMFIRRDFDRMKAEEWLFIAGFLFLIAGLILSPLRIFVWLGGLILFIYAAANAIWVWTKLR